MLIRKKMNNRILLAVIGGTIFESVDPQEREFMGLIRKMLKWCLNSANDLSGGRIFNSTIKDNLLKIFYQNLLQTNFKPSFILDIGSNTGTWTREFLRYFPKCKVLMIDPQERMVDHIKDLLRMNVSFLPVGVGCREGVLDFTLHQRSDSCSFIYSEEEATAMGVQRVKVPIKTINSIIREGGHPFPDLIKIDAEGFDLEVIDGASDCFGKTEVFLVEAAVCNHIYTNTIASIIEKMDSIGYQLFDITDLNRPFGTKQVLWLVELAFIKKNGNISNSLKEIL